MTSSGVTAQKPYVDCIRRTLTAALCLTNFPSRIVERHNKPEIEARQTPECILRPVVITRSKYEQCLIETSINSVRVSIKIKQMDELEELLAHRFTQFLMRRAENFFILRRKPVPVCSFHFYILYIDINNLFSLIGI